MIGRFFGAGEEHEIEDTIGTMLSLFVALSVVITALLLALTDPIVDLLGTPAEAVEQTRGYIFINAAGIATMFAYNALAAIFRGFGDSTSPLIFVGIACVANVIGDLVLVGLFGWGAPRGRFRHHMRTGAVGVPRRHLRAPRKLPFRFSTQEPEDKMA